MKTVLMLVTRPVSPTVSHVKGDTVTIEDDLADYYLRIGAARYAAPPPIPAMLGKDANGNTVLVGGDVSLPVNQLPRSIAKSGVLMCLQSSGIVGDNGAVTGLTAFPVALGKCFLYFPANALYAGSVAGFYYSNVTGTTVATVYNNRWTGGQPVFPATPTPIVAVGPGAYTQTTGVDITAASFTVAGGALGAHGSLTLLPNFGANNTAGAKSWAAKFANNVLIGRSNTTATMDNTPVMMRNAGAVDSQIATSYTGFSPNAGALFQRFNVDTTVDQELIITLKLAVATDFIFLQGYDANLSF